ncbi:MAG: hypothetical protein WC943_16075 [Elusimicrobiota bacterium]|jgi:hypothetical protein
MDQDRGRAVGRDFVVRGLAAFALLTLAACADVRDRRKIVVEPGTDMSRYQSFGVMPFADDGGKKGRALAEHIVKALQDRGLKTVDIDLMQREYRKVRGDAFGLTLFSLSTLRRQTKAELLVTGSITARSFSLLVQELESGEVLINVAIARRAGTIPEDEVRETIMKYLSGEGDPGGGGISAEAVGNP